MSEAFYSHAKLYDLMFPSGGPQRISTGPRPIGPGDFGSSIASVTGRVDSSPGLSRSGSASASPPGPSREHGLARRCLKSPHLAWHSSCRLIVGSISSDHASIRVDRQVRPTAACGTHSSDVKTRAVTANMGDNCTCGSRLLVDRRLDESDNLVEMRTAATSSIPPCLTTFASRCRSRETRSPDP
jgi:hypothetical protein